MLCSILSVALFIALVGFTFAANLEEESKRFCNFEEGDLTLQELLFNLTFSHVRSQLCISPPNGYLLLINFISTRVPAAAERALGGDPVPIRFVFDNVTFRGSKDATFHFSGKVVGVANSELIDSILADLPAEFASQMNENVQLQSLRDFFSDLNSLRLPDTSLRWNPTTMNEFSQYIKAKISEFMPRPLELLINSSRFIGGMRFVFSNVLPVGTSISVVNTDFSALYSDMYFPGTYSSCAWITLSSLDLVSGRITLANNTVKVMSSLTPSPTSRYFYDRETVGTAGIYLIQILSALLFHNASLSIYNASLRVQGVAVDMAIFIHPNVEILRYFVSKHNLTMVALPSLRTWGPHPEVALVGGPLNTQPAIYTEGSSVTISTVSIEVNGSSVLIPATDEMWLATSNATGSNATLEDLRATSPTSIPQTCYILEVPVLVQAHVIKIPQILSLELTRDTSFIVERVDITTNGHQPRGGRPHAGGVPRGEFYLLNTTEMSDANLRGIAEDMSNALMFNRTSGTCGYLFYNLTTAIYNIDHANTQVDTAQALNGIRRLVDAHYIQSTDVVNPGVAPTLVVSVSTFSSRTLRVWVNSSVLYSVRDINFRIMGMFLAACAVRGPSPTLALNVTLIVTNFSIQMDSAVSIVNLITGKAFYPPLDINPIVVALLVSNVQLLDPSSTLIVRGVSMSGRHRIMERVLSLSFSAFSAAQLYTSQQSQVIVEDVIMSFVTRLEVLKSRGSPTDVSLVRLDSLSMEGQSRFIVRQSTVTLSMTKGAISAFTTYVSLDLTLSNSSLQIISVTLTHLESEEPTSLDNVLVFVVQFTMNVILRHSSIIVKSVTVDATCVSLNGLVCSQEVMNSDRAFTLSDNSIVIVQYTNLNLRATANVYQCIFCLYSLFVEDSTVTAAFSTLNVTPYVVENTMGYEPETRCAIIMITKALAIRGSGTVEAGIGVSFLNITAYIETPLNAKTCIALLLDLAGMATIRVEGPGAVLCIKGSQFTVLPSDASAIQKEAMSERWSWRTFSNYPMFSTIRDYGAMNMTRKVEFAVVHVQNTLSVTFGGSIQIVDTTIKAFISAANATSPELDAVSLLVLQKADFLSKSSLWLQNTSITIFVSFRNQNSSVWAPSPSPIAQGLFVVARDSLKLCDVTINGESITSGLTPLFFPYSSDNVEWWLPPSLPLETKQSWLARGLNLQSFDTVPSFIFANGVNYSKNNRILLDHALAECTSSFSETFSSSITKPPLVTNSLTTTMKVTQSARVPANTASSQRLQTHSQILTSSLSAAILPSVTVSTSEQCNETEVRLHGLKWNQSRKSDQQNEPSGWKQQLFESEVQSGISFTASLNADATLNVRRERAIISAPSAPSLVIDSSSLLMHFELTRGSIHFELAPHPAYECHSEKVVDIYIPASLFVRGPCVQRLMEDRDLTSLWRARQVDLLVDGAVSIYIYFMSISIIPNVGKPLAKEAVIFAAASNGFALAAGILTSTAVVGSAPYIQAIGSFARLGCSSEKVVGYFGSMWILTPLFASTVFGTGEIFEMISVLAGNSSLIVLVVVVQLIAALVVRTAFGHKGNVFSVIRFPSVALSLMISLHSGTFFAASRLLRLVSSSSDVETAAYIVAIAGIIYSVLIPAALFISAWWFAPRTFQVYDSCHPAVTKQLKPRWLSTYLPLGAIFPETTRYSAGAFLTSFHSPSHLWTTSPFWVSILSGIAGFADFDGQDDSRCYAWSLCLGLAYLAMAAIVLWAKPKRYPILGYVDVALLTTLGILFGITVPFRILSESSYWPEMTVLVLAFGITACAIAYSLLALLFFALEWKVQSLHPPTYILWIQRSRGKMQAERRSYRHRIDEDRIILDEMLLEAEAHELAELNISCEAQEDLTVVDDHFIDQLTTSPRDTRTSPLQNK